MTCERTQQDMIDALYGELSHDDMREFETHIASCATCAALYHELRATGAVMHDRERRDPGEKFWNEYYARLEARLERELRGSDVVPVRARRRLYLSWGYRMAAAVAVLAAGVWIGHSGLDRERVVNPGTQMVRHADTTAAGAVTGDAGIASTLGHADRSPIDGPAPAGPSGDADRRVQLASADVRARDYIDRSQVLLLELVNAAPDTTRAGRGDYRLQQTRARALVSEASALRDDLPGGDNRRLRELVTELQLVLREIANIETRNDVQAVEIIRNRVSREGVLMKIDVEQMREEVTAPRHVPKRGDAIDG